VVGLDLVDRDLEDLLAVHPSDLSSSRILRRLVVMTCILVAFLVEGADQLMVARALVLLIVGLQEHLTETFLALDRRELDRKILSPAFGVEERPLQGRPCCQWVLKVRIDP